MTKFNIGDEVYIKVKVKSITIMDIGDIRYTVINPLRCTLGGLGEIGEEELYSVDEEEE
jgi:hypothetical protein